MSRLAGSIGFAEPVREHKVMVDPLVAGSEPMLGLQRPVPAKRIRADLAEHYHAP